MSFLIENREVLIEDGRLVKQALSDHTEIDAELQSVIAEMEVVAGLIEKSIATNAITALDQDEYAKNYESLTEPIKPCRSVIRLSHGRGRISNSRRMNSADSSLNSESLNSSTPNGRTADSAPPLNA